MYTSKVESFTKKKVFDIIVSKKFLGPDDHILIIDDFLATGEAVSALIEIARQAGAKIVGCGTVVEKSFQPGRKRIEAQGIEVCSLARIKEMTPQGIVFED